MRRRSAKRHHRRITRETSFTKTKRRPTPRRRRLAADARRDAALQSARAARAAVASASSRRSRARERSAAELVDQKRVLVGEVRERARAWMMRGACRRPSQENASGGSALVAAVAGLSVDDAWRSGARRGSAPMVG